MWSERTKITITHLLYFLVLYLGLNYFKFLTEIGRGVFINEYEHFYGSLWASLVAQLVKNPPAMQETWVQSLGRSPGEGKGYPLQYSGLENSMEYIVHGAANWCFWTVLLEKTLESPLDCKEIQPVHPKGNQSWMFIGRTDAEAEAPNTLATWCKELTHWKRPWSWERLKAGREGNDGGWDSWTASPIRWTWVWVSSGSWWWTGKSGVLQSMGFQSQTRLSDRTDWQIVIYILYTYTHIHTYIYICGYVYIAKFFLFNFF